jgi:predicted nucleotidyltransferase
MRLSSEDQQAIRSIIEKEFGAQASVRLFGSRLHDDLRGGDVDLLVELPEPVADPAVIAAALAVRIMRALKGRSVDVVLRAPNLRHLPIHDIAAREGVLL